MAFDDPVVWVLIIALVIFLFGANKIPDLARSLGQAKKEFDQARNQVTSLRSEITNTARDFGSQLDSKESAVAANTSGQQAYVNDDPLLIAARNEGIDTRGKTREEIASELASKLNSNKK